MKTNYFVITSHENNVVAVIQNNGKSTDFKEAIEEVVREYYALDSTKIEQSINVNNYIGVEKDLTLKCLNDDEEEYEETIGICSVLMYGN